MDLSRREKTLLEALTTRGGRKRSGCCRCEGVRAVRELLTFYPGLVQFVAATQKGLAALGTASLPAEIRLLTEREMEEFSSTVNSQGIIAVASIPPEAAGAVNGSAILALDQLGDPGNFGTIARSMRAAGWGELWYTKGSIDPWGDKAIRSGMGAQFGLRMRRFDDLAVLTETARSLGCGRIFFTDPHRGENCFSCEDLFDHSVIVIGGEPNGILGSCAGARHILIPMPGNYESINAAQAATVLIFEAVRRKTTTV